VAGSFKNHKDASGFINAGNFLDHQSDYNFWRKTLMMITMTMMSIGWDCLWTTAANGSVVHENGVPWWNIDRGNLFVHQSSLRTLPSESSSSKTGGTGEGNFELCLAKYLCSYFEGVFIMPQNLMTWCRRLSFLCKGSRATDFYHPWKLIALGVVWTREPSLKLQARNRRRDFWTLPCEVSLFILRRGVYYASKSYDMMPKAFLPL
jgi:hypothetical protein